MLVMSGLTMVPGKHVTSIKVDDDCSSGAVPSVQASKVA